VADIPGLYGPQFAAVAAQFSADVPTALLRMHQHFGDIFGYGVFDPNPVQICHPEGVRDVLITRQPHFEKGIALKRLRRVLGQGLLTSEGTLYLRQRRMIAPAFHKDRLPAYATLMVDQTQRMLARWQGQERIDVQAEMLRLTLAVVTRTLFAIEIDSELDTICRAVTDVMVLVPYIIQPPGEQLPPEVARRFEQAMSELDTLVYRIIDERQREGGGRGDLLSQLIAARDVETDGSAMSRQQLRDEVMTLFLAGHETTSTLLAWVWHALSEHPSVADELYAEVDAVVGDRLPGPDDMPRLVYTGHVIQEVLRLWPPVWTIGRLVKEPLAIGAYHLRHNTPVLVSPYVTHRDARWFARPEAFEPRRWESLELPKCAFIPFSAGIRMCTGEGFARLEATLAVAAVAQRFRLRFEQRGPLPHVALLTLRPRGSMWARPEPRQRPAVNA
jgi:cytochrome P450